MKKKFITLLMAIVFIFALAGCSSGNEDKINDLYNKISEMQQEIDSWKNDQNLRANQRNHKIFMRFKPWNSGAESTKRLIENFATPSGNFRKKRLKNWFRITKIVFRSKRFEKRVRRLQSAHNGFGSRRQYWTRGLRFRIVSKHSYNILTFPFLCPSNVWRP